MKTTPGINSLSEREKAVQFFQQQEVRLKAEWDSCYQELCGCIRNDGKTGILRQSLRYDLRKQCDKARDVYLAAHAETQDAIFAKNNS